MTNTKGLRIRIRGQVQGVGFRPFIWKLAQELGIKGTVCNDTEGVLIDAFGAELDHFVKAIEAQKPSIAVITAIETQKIAASEMDGFDIIASREGIARTSVTPDLALCGDCVTEIRDPNAMRSDYAFTNCTNCGPRFSIVETLPYDRANTTMRHFALCAFCATQYGDPNDRRFHAQPIACPNCGPVLDYHGLHGIAAIKAAAKDLLAGKILAIKGLGGFHLVVDAQNEKAIAALRERKQRPSKPLALMANIFAIKKFAVLNDQALEMLKSPAAPILLLKKKEALPEALAPGQNRLGWMLPYTPLHQMLIDVFDGILVMTSGNLSGEPQITDNDEAREKLASIADRFLLNNRPIARRLDDSVVQFFSNAPHILRRARGFAPQMLALPPGFENAPPITGFGAHLKSTITMIKNGEALMSHHLGDLDHWQVREEFEKAYADYSALFDHETKIAAVDLHPDFSSRQFAQSLGVPVIEVQHHHAHMAAVMAEHWLPIDHAPLLGIMLDGLGLGVDGTIWGGEILIGDYSDFERVAWLKPAPLIGGDQAQKEPYRNALVRLDDAGLGDMADRLFSDCPLQALRDARRAEVNAWPSSSAGRLFDGFAALLGISAKRQSFEGEAAMTLQALAERANNAAPYAFHWEGDVMNPNAILQDWALMREKENLETQALRFHKSIALAFASKARALAQERGLKTIALSGGCIQNTVLLEELLMALDGFEVIYPKSYPANDGGVSLGQAMIAAARSLRW